MSRGGGGHTPCILPLDPPLRRRGKARELDVRIRGRGKAREREVKKCSGWIARKNTTSFELTSDRSRKQNRFSSNCFTRHVLFKAKFRTSVKTQRNFTKNCRNVSHSQQQQSYSGLRSPGRPNSTYSWNDSWVQTFHSFTKNIAYLCCSPFAIVSFVSPLYRSLILALLARLICLVDKASLPTNTVIVKAHTAPPNKEWYQVK